MLGNLSIRSVRDCASLSQHSDLLGSHEELHRHSLRTRRRGRAVRRQSQAQRSCSACPSAAAGAGGRSSCPCGSATRPPAPPSGAAWSFSTARASPHLGATSLSSFLLCRGGLVEATKLMEQHDRNCLPEPARVAICRCPQGTGFFLHLWKARWSRQDNLHALHAYKTALQL